jgi:hypothetical protein
MIVKVLILIERPEHTFVVYDNFRMSLRFWLQGRGSTVQFTHIILGVANTLSAMVKARMVHGHFTKSSVPINERGKVKLSLFPHTVPQERTSNIAVN